jgi:hypothetical protein
VGLVGAALVLSVRLFRVPNAALGPLFGAVAAVAAAGAIVLLPLASGVPTYERPANLAAVILAFTMGGGAGLRCRRTGARAAVVVVLICAFVRVAIGTLEILATAPPQGRG